MIIADNYRSRIYLQQLVINRLIPNIILILSDKKVDASKVEIKNKKKNIDLSKSIFDTIKTENLNFTELKTTTINSAGVINILKEREELIFVYSGHGGTIIKKSIFKTNKLLLHVHGGYLPKFKGSTTNYYSLIMNNELGSSSLFLNEKIDEGPILIRRKFKIKSKIQDFDSYHDNYLRSKILIETIKKIRKEKKIKLIHQKDYGDMYFIIHPVLKHIALSLLNIK